MSDKETNTTTPEIEGAAETEPADRPDPEESAEPSNGDTSVSAESETAEQAPEDVPPQESANMEQQAVARFDVVEALRLSPSGQAGVYRAAVLAAGQPSAHQRMTIAQQLMDYFLKENQALLLPMVYSQSEWQKLQQQVPDLGWLSALSEGPVFLYQRLEKAADHPRPIKRWFVHTIRRYLRTLDSVLGSEGLPPDIALGACASMVHDVFDLLCATKGERFSADLAGLEFFEQNFVGEGRFSREDILFYFQLVGLEQQVGNYHMVTLIDSRRQFEWLANRVTAIFRKFERFAIDTYTTQADRQQSRKMMFYGLGGGALALVVLFILYFVLTAASVQAPASVEGKPGGISGDYYKGMNFETKVLTRIDKSINFSSKLPLDPKLPKDKFSVRWQGQLQFSEDGKQHICCECDDGCRFFFNGKKLFDDWGTHRPRRTCGSVDVKKGWYPIKIEYFENGGDAKLRLMTGKDKNKVKTVSSGQLCCKE